MAGADKEAITSENKDDASIWTQNYEEIFIELMKEEVLKGNRSTPTFTKQSWKHIKEKLCAQTKRNYSDTQLRNKFNQLRQKQEDFKALWKEDGTAYNTISGKITATDEVWDRLIRVNKSYNRFRKEGHMFYEQLCIIFDNTSSTDSNTHHSTRSPFNGDDYDDAFNDDAISKSSHTNGENSLEAKLTLALANAIVNETARQTELLERSMATSSPYYLIHESVEALNEIDGISGEVYAKAIQKFEKEVSRALFLKMPKHRRIDWLLNLK